MQVAWKIECLHKDLAVLSASGSCSASTEIGNIKKGTERMDLLNGNIKTLYLKYFGAAIGSSMIMSIYGIVDTICIGRYEGPNGTAAVACFFPLWTLLFAMGLLFGIGGSVIMAQKRGAGDKKEGDKYFSVGLIISVIVSIIIFVLYNLCQRTLLSMCGASGDILELTVKYAFWISVFSPLFLIGQYLIPFIRNDGAPLYTTIAAVAGGVFNVFGDIFFVFVLDMGIYGAGLATALGQCISFAVLVSYLFTKQCTLKFTTKNLEFGVKLKRIVAMGSSNFAIDVAMGVLAVIFNKQIMTYLGAAALSVYGVISNISTMVQTFGYAVGESAQALISVNYGAGKKERIKQTVKYAGVLALGIGVVCCLIGIMIPIPMVRFYMSATPEIIKIAPGILRAYFLAFIFLVFNVFSTYYFQAINKPMTAMLVSLLRGVILSGILLLILPAIFGGSALWFAVPIAEVMVFLYVGINMKKSL